MQKAPSHILTKRLNWKGFFIALLVVIVVEILAFRLLSTSDPKVAKPTEISTANWKTHTNTAMGFSVKLPSGWYTHDETQDGDKTETYLSYPIDSSSSILWMPHQEAAITVIKYPSDRKDIKQEAQQWVDKTNKTNPGTFNKQIETTTVAGKVAVILEAKANNMEYVYLNNGNTTYMITLATPTEDPNSQPPITAVPFEKYQAMFDQILATFTFTN